MVNECFQKKEKEQLSDQLSFLEKVFFVTYGV